MVPAIIRKHFIECFHIQKFYSAYDIYYVQSSKVLFIFILLKHILTGNCVYDTLRIKVFNQHLVNWKNSDDDKLSKLTADLLNLQINKENIKWIFEQKHVNNMLTMKETSFYAGDDK